MLTELDLQIASRTLAQECRGEPPDGQAAVAWVIRNRLKAGQWGKTLASVCLWNRHVKGGGQVFQFSGWREEDPNFAYAVDLPDADPVLLGMRALILKVMAADGSADPTGGAMSYFAASMNPPPPWSIGATSCGKFGHQLFWRDVK